MKKFLDFSNIKGDFLGGLTAGIVALPLALAFGVSSGLGPAAGLYGAIFISFFAALFGGTPTQISGPTAPMTVLSVLVVSGIMTSHDADMSKALPIILSVFLLAGLIQILLGVIGVGKYIKYIPYPVLSGFMTAIGVMIIITQLPVIFGYQVNKDEDFINQQKPLAEELILINILEEEAEDGILVLEDLEKTLDRSHEITEEEIHNEALSLAEKEASGTVGAIKVLPRAFKNINYNELLIALITIFIIYGFSRITKAVPSSLVALLLITAAVVIAGIHYIKIPEIPSEPPKPVWAIFTEFNISEISPYIFTAITLAVLGSIDSLLTSIVADNMTKTNHKPNQELIGQGIGNTIASIFAGIPGAGATIRTVVNIEAGGKTKLSGMIAGTILFVILIALSPLASSIPNAVLAGILITVGIGVIDWKGLKAIPNMEKDIRIGKLKFSSEAIILIIVMLLATFWNLVNAVGIGLIISSLIFMKKMGDLTSKQSELTPIKEESWPDDAQFPSFLKEEVFIKHINGPLFFGSTSDFQQLSRQIPDTARAVVIRMQKMDYIDQSGLYALEEVLLNLSKKGVTIYLVELHEQPEEMMENIGIIPALVPKENIYDSFEELSEWAAKNIPDEIS